jgi:protocatechuate 3,4-dioxygenase beta subunit
MDNDDLPVGRVLTRREAIAMIGGLVPVAWMLDASCSETSGLDHTNGITMCTAKPQLTEGPYYVDVRLNRSDIRSDTNTAAVKAGLPLALSFVVSRISAGACTPLANAIVDVWHCDALGVYSGVRDPGFDTVGQNWLRGYQTTDATGTANFTTVFPGWYQGRASHIHFNIRSAVSGNTGYDFTSQLFFNESLLTQIYTTQTPYTQKGDAGRRRNNRDGIYNRGGSQLLLNPTPSGTGYAATFNVGLVI